MKEFILKKKINVIVIVERLSVLGQLSRTRNNNLFYIHDQLLESNYIKV